MTFQIYTAFLLLTLELLKSLLFGDNLMWQKCDRMSKWGVSVRKIPELEKIHMGKGAVRMLGKGCAYIQYEYKDGTESIVQGLL